MHTALVDLYHGFGIALEPANIMWCFLGVLIGNLVGVLPGLGILSSVSILLPLTFGMHPVPAILMLAGIYYGSQYGGAICSILLNLPCHAPHAVTCLDGFPLTRQGKAGTALGITIIGACVGAAFGIIVMIFFAPVVVSFALDLGPSENCALMFLGLLSGATLARGSALKGVAMTIFGMLVGLVGTDVQSGATRFTFGSFDLMDGVDLAGMALGLFGITEFFKSVNHIVPLDLSKTKVRMRDMVPTKAELKSAFFPMWRGTIIGSLSACVPGAGPTIASFVSYAIEKKISKTPEKFGTGHIPGIASPEASTHSAIQCDFIPTMTLGIPGDASMALLLGALMIQGIQPGPQLISQHPDVFWGLVASFWVGNIILVILNVPMIGVWVKMLAIPYRYLYPSALFFMYIGVFTARNSLFDVATILAFGILGYILLTLRFHPAPVLVGFVLGPRVEETFRRSVQVSYGTLDIFWQRPITATIIGICAAMILIQVVARFRAKKGSLFFTKESTVMDEL
jgi:putative tricarboxylic transport membrane protein